MIINLEQAYYCGLHIIPAPGETVREVLDRSLHTPEYPVCRLKIFAPCGSEVFYETLDDIPDHDVPCSCGNPNHWFIKIGDKQ